MKREQRINQTVAAKISAGIALLLISNMAAAGELPTVSVPEPGPFGLLILAGVGLLLARRIGRNK